MTKYKRLVSRDKHLAQIIQTRAPSAPNAEGLKLCRYIVAEFRGENAEQHSQLFMDALPTDD